MNCQRCGFESSAEMHFCGKCGNELTASLNLLGKAHSLEENFARIQRNLPEGLKKKFLAQKDKIKGERRQVTVMFCSMKGFPFLTHKLCPQEVFL